MRWTQDFARCTTCRCPLPFHADDCGHNPIRLRLVRRALSVADRYKEQGRSTDLAELESIAAMFTNAGNVADAALVARLVDPDHA